MMNWLQTFGFVLLWGGWFLGNCMMGAQGIQGLWQPENKFWKTCLVLAPLSTAAMFATFISMDKSCLSGCHTQTLRTTRC
jgi:hypothetical protein